MSSQVGKIAILGAGTWGTTLAWLYGTHSKRVSLWTRQSEKARLFHLKHSLELPLAVTIPQTVQVSSDLAETINQASIIVFSCTSQSMRSVAREVQVQLSSQLKAKRTELVLVSAAKGLELNTLRRMSQVLGESIPGLPICALSGPNLAAEILQGLPTASVIACNDIEAACFVQQNLSVSVFRLYTNQDLTGVELGGTLKNIIAIAAGCSDGLNLGINAKAALLTRGLAEMTRLAQHLGAKPLTLSGLSGMGDLFATCSSSLSRNYRLGLGLASGKSKDKVMLELGAVAEGIPTTEAVCELANTLGIELPIAEQVKIILDGESTPKKAIMALMQRPLAGELGAKV
ncbi:MAG: NAD(P)-dependent glycerol-3-phosphate dehydrogenase [Candidatus Melainabacteria bacterium]|nr:NAD(P)-dependent glycerol-3-phosphate dehydrogenase [Candidatus Melainabacteria bacterium]